MTGAELDVPAVLTAADRLLRALRGPLGGAATWEWGDLLAAATGRSPFEMTTLVRSVDPRVPEPAKAEPADVAAQLVQLADGLDDEAGASRLRQVARLLDPVGGGTTTRPSATPPSTPTPSPVAQPSPPPSPSLSPPTPPSPASQPYAYPAPPQAPVDASRTVLPGQGAGPYRGGTADLDGASDQRSSGRRRATGRTPKKRKRPGPWIGLAILAYVIIRGYVESGGS